ncbi:hypothetical protein VKT23_018092 [Stygiomarasmius scandens]|uniref:F-box domain-containing protein n=1 Tax=Marasmiellus scandens TaxID=2682957 RepID=A0ABR1IUJ8_9AGAR
MKFSSSPVFPLLHTIAWDGFREYGLHDVVMFLHEGIRKCMLWGRSNGFSDPGVELLLTALQHRTPSLVALEVNFPPRPTLLDPLINLIGSLKSLVHLKVPGFRDTSRILSSIQNPSALKNLEFMTGFIGLEASGVATINDVLVHYTGVGDAFSQLERLRADLRNYKAIYPFFQGQGNFQCLTTVFVYVYAIDEPKSISGLFQGIAQTCPRMTQLRVQYSPFHCGRVEPQEVNIEFEDWSSILACKEITVFRFHTPYPLDLADHDIADIGLAWPRLETFDLFLNSKYFRTGPPLKNSPSLLSVFYLTRLCPNLKVVRLNLDDYPLSKTPPFTTENLPVQFHSDDLRVAVLDSLHIGPGIINQGDELIWPRLLGQICPPHCELSRDLQRVLSAHSNPAEDQKWRTILKLFPQFSELYSDLRSKDERIGALEQEVLSLTALKSPTG